MNYHKELKLHLEIDDRGDEYMFHNPKSLTLLFCLEYSQYRLMAVIPSAATRLAQNMFKLKYYPLEKSVGQLNLTLEMLGTRCGLYPETC